MQIAVHHPDQVVQAFARGERERAHAFRFVHFAVAEHAPDFAFLAVDQASVRQIAHETRVVDRTDRAYAHGAGGELPKVRHQPRMRVAGQAARAFARRFEFLAVMRQIGFAQSAFKVSAGVHAGRAVRLEKNQIALVLLVTCMEKMVVADLEQIGGAGVTGDMPAEFAVGTVGFGHHGQRIPAHQRSEFFFDGQIAGVRLLRLHGNGVDVGRDEFGRPFDLALVSQGHHLVQQVTRAFGAVSADHSLEGLTPFGGFCRVNVSGFLQHFSESRLGFLWH